LSVDQFYMDFGKLWRNFEVEKSKTLKEWISLYTSGQNRQLFNEYSSFNFGRSNAKQAFIES